MAGRDFPMGSMQPPSTPLVDKDGKEVAGPSPRNNTSPAPWYSTSHQRASQIPADRPMQSVVNKSTRNEGMSVGYERGVVYKTPPYQAFQPISSSFQPWTVQAVVSVPRYIPYQVRRFTTDDKMEVPTAAKVNPGNVKSISRGQRLGRFALGVPRYSTIPAMEPAKGTK